jgi:hypothetical protein
MNELIKSTDNIHDTFSVAQHMYYPNNRVIRISHEDKVHYKYVAMHNEK